jgi:predicted nucleotidyltransferase component of viral defense system
MIPLAYIREWRNLVPWQETDMIEQDLVICRALVEIFKDSYLFGNLAFRGGTSIHKLFMDPQPRYSEDIDLVQIKSMPIKETITRLQHQLSFLGQPDIRQKANNNTIVFKYNSESMQSTILKLKVEINCREHFSVLGFKEMDYSVKSEWFSGNCTLRTYSINELLGTKLRALYQRRKGRDLYDLFKVMSNTEVNHNELLQCYRAYIKFAVAQPPTSKQFLRNMEEKMLDKDFLGDIKALIRPDEIYNPNEAWEMVKTELVEKI